MQADAYSDDEAAGAVKSAAPASVLREAREQQQLSVDDVAHALHLSREIILALEAADFAALGPLVFVRGYLRNYARLLELSPQLVLADFPVADLEPEEFRTMSLKTELKPGVNLHGWLLWSLSGLVLLIAAIVLLVSMGNSGSESTSAAEKIEPATVKSSPTATGSVSRDVGLPGSVAVPEAGSTSTDEAVAAAAENAAAGTAAEAGSASPGDNSVTAAAIDSAAGSAEPAQLVAVAPEPVATPATGMVALKLTFSDECWVEIADSRRSLLYGLEKGGAVVELEGVPPFKLFFGNREAVQLTLAGEPFAIPAGLPDAGNTARFTIVEDQL